MTTTAPEITVCKNHPDRETRLRCNRCSEPICSSCAVRTPTGYRCPQCVRGQQAKYDTAEWYDYLLALGTALILSAIGGWIAGFFGFFTLFVAPAAGAVIAEVVRRVLRGRRARLLFRLVAVAVVVGGLLPQLPLLLLMLLGGRGIGMLFSLIWPLLYVALATSTVYYRLSGIRLSL